MKFWEDANKKMDPVFTLPYSEFRVANRLAELFKKQDGYSILLPSSRTEKGFDLALLKQNGIKRNVITIQVKTSRTYGGKRESAERFAHDTWFQTFSVPRETDWIFLVGMYPNSEDKTRKSSATWWQEIILCFSREEMTGFLSRVKTRKGTPDKFFGFGFNEPTTIYQTRGDQNREKKDYSSFLLKKRSEQILQSFS
jgi:hypothetical protein